VPFPIDEIVSDHQFVGTTAEGEKAAMIVAAKLEGVRAVTDAVRSAGLKPVQVDVSPIAVVNALKFVDPGLAGCSVVLDVGAKTTNLIILEGEKIYNRSIPVAGNTITKEIAQTFGCSFEEAEQLKLERGYVALGGVTEDEDEVSDRVSKVIRTVLTRLHAEISRSINFYRSQQGGSAPARLFLTGGSSRLPQLAEFFQESLQVEVAFLNPFTRVALGSKVDRTGLENDVFVLAESVGLALHGAGSAWLAVNLMPPELIEEARAIKRIPFLVMGGLSFFAALGLVWWSLTAETEVVRRKAEEVAQLNATIERDKKTLDAKQKEVAAKAATCDEILKLMWGRSIALRRVEMVRGCLDRGMWIREWKNISPKEGAVAAPGVETVRVTVRGWRDGMEKVEKAWRASHPGEKLKTVGEIVASRILERAEAGMLASRAPAKDGDGSQPSAGAVDLVSGKSLMAEVANNIMEFDMQIAFAGAPSVSGVGAKKQPNNGKVAK